MNYHKGHYACGSKARRRLGKGRRRAEKQFLKYAVKGGKLKLPNKGLS